MMVVSLVGWRVAGFWGALVTTGAVAAPSSILTLLVSGLWYRFKDADWRKALQAGLQPVTAGLIMASAALLIASTAVDWTAARGHGRDGWPVHLHQAASDADPWRRRGLPARSGWWGNGYCHRMIRISDVLPMPITMLLSYMITISYLPKPELSAVSLKLMKSKVSTLQKYVAFGFRALPRLGSQHDMKPDYIAILN